MESLGYDSEIDHDDQEDGADDDSQDGATPQKPKQQAKMPLPKAKAGDELDDVFADPLKRRKTADQTTPRLLSFSQKTGLDLIEELHADMVKKINDAKEATNAWKVAIAAYPYLT